MGRRGNHRQALRPFLVALVWLVLASPAAAQWLKKADELLEPEKAFRFSTRVIEGAVEVQFAIADGYYLYRGQSVRAARRGRPAAGRAP
jgi:thiol:disulfide interchange protein